VFQGIKGDNGIRILADSTIDLSSDKIIAHNDQ
jgi:hypothetical protein